MRPSLTLSKKCYLKLSFLMLLLCLSLSSCHHAPAPSGQASIIQSLQKQGVSVYAVGETVTILVPGDYLFAVGSANIQRKYRPVLKQVANLLKTYTLVSVHVTAYSDNTSALDLSALTTKQAQRVANTLWNQGIDARLISAEGGSSSDLVVKGGGFSERGPNRRVEIKFRYYLPMSYYD